MLSAETHRFSSAERKFLAELDYADNVGNLMSKNTRILDDGALSALRQFIGSQILLYKKNLLRMRDENAIYITQSWANIARPGQFHPKHKHPNSLISGVMFVNDNTGSRQPPIRFHRTAEIFPLELVYDDLNEFNSSCSVFDPVQGRLILFPSLVEHDVEVNKSNEDRVSLSFNTFVRGVIGGNEQLTEVALAQ